MNRFFENSSLWGAWLLGSFGLTLPVLALESSLASQGRSPSPADFTLTEVTPSLASLPTAEISPEALTEAVTSEAEPFLTFAGEYESAQETLSHFRPLEDSPGRSPQLLPPLSEQRDASPALAQGQSGDRVTPESETVSPVVETIETHETVQVVTEAEIPTNPYFDRANTFYATFYGIPLQGRDSAQDFIGRATFDLGYGLGGAIGYRFNSNLRGEIEYSYFDNGFQDLFFFVPGTTTVAPNQPEQSAGATVTGRAIMINAYYDFPVSEQFRPYIGAGIGTYNARINDLSPPGFGGFVANGDSADRFAFQLRAGISYLFTPNFEVFTGYRYFKGQEFEYIIENTGTPPLVLRPNGLQSNSWEIGLRYNF